MTDKLSCMYFFVFVPPISEAAAIHQFCIPCHLTNSGPCILPLFSTGYLLSAVILISPNSKPYSLSPFYLPPYFSSSISRPSWL